jgi:hypothetical protein
MMQAIRFDYDVRAMVSRLPRLRPYQAEAQRAIVDSVIERRGLTFTVMMARQAGKNELSAQVELGLLMKHSEVAVDAVKCAPTFIPQGYVSMRRLRDRIAQLGFDGLFVQEPGPALRINRARQLFLSADDSSNVVGHTAGLPARRPSITARRGTTRRCWHRPSRRTASWSGATASAGTSRRTGP